MPVRVGSSEGLGLTRGAPERRVERMPASTSSAKALLPREAR